MFSELFSLVGGKYWGKNMCDVFQGEKNKIKINWG